MSFEDALFAAVAKADREGVVAALRGRTEAERRAAATAVLRRGDSYGHFKHTAGGLVWHERTRLGNFRIEHQQPPVVRLAILGTASMAQMRRVAWGLSWVDDDAGAAVLLDRNPPWLQSWAQWILTTRTMEVRWPLVRNLVRAEAIERPEAYTRALLTQRWDEGELQRALAADPEFWERDVWDMLAHRDEEGSLRAAEHNGWSELILARDLDRDRLLDALLSGLVDESAYRSAWFVRAWKALKVTREERAARNDRLRALLGSAAEPVVGFAVAELAKPGGSVAPHELAPALAASTKTTVRGALKLLDGAPESAAIALAHPDAGIQGEVLDRLERAPLDAATRGALLHHLDLLAATQRPRAEALLNLKVPGTFISAPCVDLDAIPAHIKAALNVGGPLPDAPIPGEPVLGESLDDSPEHALDALLRACEEPVSAEVTADYPEARIVLSEHERVAYARVHRLVAPIPEHTTVKRPFDTEQRAARGAAGAFLPLPTHARGWIDPRVLVTRMHAHAGDEELTRALYRLAPDHRAEALAAAGDVPGRHGALLRCALGGDDVTGDDPAAFVARAVRLPPLVALEVGLGADFRARVDPGLPEGVDAFPARRDVACAHAFRPAAGHLGEYVTYAPAIAGILETLLAPREPIPPLALRLIVVALGSLDEREHLLAADLLIAAIEDGRVDALPTDDVEHIKPNRLATRLPTIVAAGPLQRAVVRDFLDAAIHRVTTRPGPLLVLFDELCAQTDTGPRHSRAHLATLKQKPARALLQRTGGPPAEEQQFALAARARRAYRWMHS